MTFVQSCSPDRYPPRGYYGPEDQWTLDLAFEGLRLGLRMAVKEKGDKPVFAECSGLVDQAEGEYHGGHRREGYATLEEVYNLPRRVSTY